MIAGLAMVCALTLVGAAPAHALVEVTLTADETTITVGESVTLSWDTAFTGPTTVVASDAWSGTRPLSGEEVFSPPLGTHTYVLTATEDEADGESVDSVTVTVVNGPITPAPVTFDGCEVTVPSTPNVTYFVDYGDEDIEELDAGTYSADYFDIGGDPVLFYAVAADGFSFADDAVTEWEYTSPEDCFGGANFVTATATCDSVTLTNITDLLVTVLFGSFDEDEPDGEIEMGPGGSETVETDRDPVDYEAYAGNPDENGFQIGSIDKPNNCGVGGADGNDHPTVAPAAGK